MPKYIANCSKIFYTNFVAITDNRQSIPHLEQQDEIRDLEGPGRVHELDGEPDGRRARVVRAHMISTGDYVVRCWPELARVEVPHELQEGLAAHTAPRDKLLHLVPRPPGSPFPTPSASAAGGRGREEPITAGAAFTDEVVEEGAARGEDAAVDGDGRTAVRHVDIGVTAVEIRVEEEALEVVAEPNQAHHLHAAAARSGPSLRAGRHRPRRQRGERAGAGAVGEVGGRRREGDGRGRLHGRAARARGCS